MVGYHHYFIIGIHKSHEELMVVMVDFIGFTNVTDNDMLNNSFTILVILV